MNTSMEYVWSGRGYTTSADIVVAGLTMTFSILQIMAGMTALWILKNIKIFHNAFGFFCASRTIVEMLSNLIHLSFSAPMTLLQDRNLNPLITVSFGYVSYSLNLLSCALHLIMSLNRCVCVYFPLRYVTIFKIKHCIFFVCNLVFVAFSMASLFYVIPCNTLGYSPIYYGYVSPGCPGVEHFRVNSFVHYSCWFLFCSGALLIDTATLVKIATMHLKFKDVVSNDQYFRRNVRFFAQSSIVNIPMLIYIVVLTLSENSPDEAKAFERTLSFVMTRITDFLNAMTLIVFNPEARRFLFRIYREHHGSVFTTSQM